MTIPENELKIAPLPVKENSTSSRPLILDLELEEDHFITRYGQWASKKTDSYPEYHIASALTILSIIAQRNAAIRLNTGKIYPNIWCFLLGASTISRKSTALKLMDRIISNEIIQKYRIPNSFSPESLIEHLSEFPQAYYLNPEAGTLLASFKKKYMAEIIDYLCELYDCEGISRRLTSKRNQNSFFCVKDPYVSMIVATTPDRFEATSEPDFFHIGFYYRFLWFYPSYERILKPVEQDTVGFDTLEVKLINDCNNLFKFLQKRKEKPVIFQLTHESLKEYNEWINQISNNFNKNREYSKLTAFSRLQVNALKLAMLFTIGRMGAIEEMKKGTILIREQHIQAAMSIVENYFLPMVVSIYEQVDQGNSSNDQKKILSALRGSGGRMARSALLRKVRLRSRDLDDALHQLLFDTHEIMEEEQKDGKNSHILYTLQV